jgi:hypothetical protein
LLSLIANQVDSPQNNLLRSLEFPKDWEQVELKPLFKSCQEAADQKSLEQMFPGPSLPEHTHPIVMTMMVENTSVPAGKDKIQPHNKNEDQSRKWEDEKLWENAEKWASVIGSLARFGTAVVEGLEALTDAKRLKMSQSAVMRAGRDAFPVTAGHGKGHHAIFGVVKLACGIVTAGSAVVLYTAMQVISHNTHEEAHKLNDVSGLRKF